MKKYIHTKQAITLLIIGTILSLIFIYLHFLQHNQLKKVGINSVFLETFSIDRKKLISSKQNDFFILKKNKETVKIKKTSFVIQKEALKKMNEKTALLKSIFHPKPSPYFSIFTKEINCPKAFLPLNRKKEGVWISWTMFANKRYGVGVCDKSEIFFINHKLLKYCSKKKDFFEIDYFIPIDSKIKQISELKKSLLQLENLIFCPEDQ